MQQYFFVLFNPENSLFYRDSQLGDTKDMLKAERFSSAEEAESELKYFKKDIWCVKKITVAMDK